MRVESERIEEASEGKKGGQTLNHSGEEHQMIERDQGMVSHFMGNGKDQKGLFKGGEYWDGEEATKHTRKEKVQDMSGFSWRQTWGLVAHTSRTRWTRKRRKRGNSTSSRCGKTRHGKEPTEEQQCEEEQYSQEVE